MQISGIDIPDKWCTLLSTIQIVDPTAMIAGGAIRDLSLGRAPKDLDIFATHIPDLMDIGSSDMDYDGMQYVKAVVTYPTDIDLSFNLVIHDPCPNQTMLESFDFGLCQVGFNGREIIKTLAYDWDFKHGMFTLRHVDRYRRSIRRYCRINQRYDFDIMIPELETKKVL